MIDFKQLLCLWRKSILLINDLLKENINKSIATGLRHSIGLLRSVMGKKERKKLKTNQQN